ncbi:MAG TPA: hypothetical protein DCZ11_12470 [Gammaproteobacteria bacterium]|nr:hypothetical protein [Gammaproteobacteria bacterium]MCH79238.1 hypothetical protein [Gammaproteobacteria bacterium]
MDTIDGIVDAILVDTAEIGAAGAGLTEAGGTGDHLTALPWNAAWDAEVQSEVQDAIEANHLDHLLAVTYDPASKPGAADARLNELVENDGGVARYTANALEQAPSGSGPTAADIADAVWEEAIADHSGTSGSTAEALAAAGAAGDPWITALPGSYTSGQAGYIIGTNLNATVSSRATQSSVDTIDGIVDDILTDTGTTLQAELDGIQADTEDIQSRLPAALVSGRMDASVGAMAANTLTASALASDAVAEIQSGLSTLDAASVRTAVGLASANLDTQLGALSTAIATVDGIVDSILLDTTEIGAAGAGLTSLPWNAAWDAEVQSEVADALAAYDPPTNAEMEARTLAAASYATASALATVDTVVDAILDDTGTSGVVVSGASVRSAVGLAAANLDTQLGDLPTNAELATALAAADDAVLAAIAALNNLSAAQVSTEIADALGTDSYGEPTGVPAASAPLATKLSWLYMALRNRVDVTATEKTFYDDGGSAEWKKALSDDATTYTEAEAAAP